MPAAERAPAFQCYADDQLADGAELSNEEFGQYWKLALYSWREMGLPSDHNRIAKVLGLTRRQLDIAWPVIGAKFELRNGRYVLPWLEDERAKQATNREKRRAAANARWGKGLYDCEAMETDAGDDAGAATDASKTDAHALQVESSTNSHLPSSNQSTTTTPDAAELERRIQVLRRNAKVRDLAASLPSAAQEVFYAFLVRATITGDSRVTHWVHKLRDWLNPEGMEGIKATPAILGTALSDYATNGFMDDGFQITARHFRAFVIYVRDGLQRPVRVGSKGWKASNKAPQPLDPSANQSAANRLTRELGKTEGKTDAG